VTAIVNTVIQRRVENPTSGSVTSYLDQSGTLVKLKIITSRYALLMMTVGALGVLLMMAVGK
jgi:hypothetical protein